MKFKNLYEALKYRGRNKIGKSVKNTDTIRGIAPPKDINIEDLSIWLRQMRKDNVLLKNNIGFGVSKIVLYNDKNTVFKFEYDDGLDQFNREISIYKKYGKKYKDILPKIYKYGKIWMIQEYLKPINKSEFKNNTNINYRDWTDALSGSGILFRSTYGKHIKPEEINNIVKDYVYNKKKEYIPMYENIKYVYNSKFFLKIAAFAIETKTSFGDLIGDNLGINKKGQVKILDFGLGGSK